MSVSRFYILSIFVILITITLETESSQEGSTKLYVGNLSWSTTDETLREAFSAYGTVLDAIVMRDRDTGRSRGFAFVTFVTIESANAAIEGLQGKDLDGRQIRVNYANARPRPSAK